MKFQFETKLPLGEHDVISRTAAMELLGQDFPLRMQDTNIGIGKVISVDYRNSNDVWLTVEGGVNEDEHCPWREA